MKPRIITPDQLESILFTHTISGEPVNLAHTNLQGFNLTNVDLSDANLRGANLSCANLTGSNLSGASLKGANLINCNLSHASFSLTQLQKARTLSGAYILLNHHRIPLHHIWPHLHH